MPLTAKGEEIMHAMQEKYGAKKGESVFYASANAGTITGVHDTRELPTVMTPAMIIAESTKYGTPFR